MLFRRGAYYSQGAKRTTRWAPTSHPFQRRRRSASNVLAKFCVFANARLTIMFCKLHLVVEVFLPSLTFAAASESDPWWVSQVGMVSQVPSLLNLRHAAPPLSGWGALGGAGGRTDFWHPQKIGGRFLEQKTQCTLKRELSEDQKWGGEEQAEEKGPTLTNGEVIKTYLYHLLEMYSIMLQLLYLLWISQSFVFSSNFTTLFKDLIKIRHGFILNVAQFRFTPHW